MEEPLELSNTSGITSLNDIEVIISKADLPPNPLETTHNFNSIGEDSHSVNEYSKLSKGKTGYYNPALSV